MNRVNLSLDDVLAYRKVHNCSIFEARLRVQLASIIQAIADAKTVEDLKPVLYSMLELKYELE